MKYRPLEDSATSHRANATVCTRLRQNTTDFIPADEWASSSPDLNPLDYCTWDIMQYLVFAKPTVSVCKSIGPQRGNQKTSGRRSLSRQFENPLHDGKTIECS